MSLILDALNRSRRDSGKVPSLATQHYPEADDSQEGGLRRYLPWVFLLAALLIIGWLVLERSVTRQAVVAGAGTLSPRAASTGSDKDPGREKAAVAQLNAAQSGKARPGKARPGKARPGEARPGRAQLGLGGSSVSQKQGAGKEADKAVAAVVSASGAQAQQPVASVPAVTAPQPEAQAGARLGVGQQSQPSRAVADLYQRKENKSPAQPASAKRAAATKTVKEQTPPAAARSSAEPREEATAPSEAQPIDIEKMVLQARDELDNTRLAEHSAPFISELSQQVKDDIPTIYYERHDYSGKPGQSTVVLNGKTVKTGGRAGTGVKVEEILPDSVVLDYRGTQFRLRALNSWINL